VPSPSALRSVSWQLPAGRFRLSHVSTLDTPRVEGISDPVSLKVVRMEGWAVDLASARPDAVWDLFLDRYRRLIFAAIRHYAQDYDDVMDVFAQVCAALREGDLWRLRTYRLSPSRSFSASCVRLIARLRTDDAAGCALSWGARRLLKRRRQRVPATSLTRGPNWSKRSARSPPRGRAWHTRPTMNGTSIWPLFVKQLAWGRPSHGGVKPTRLARHFGGGRSP